MIDRLTKICNNWNSFQNDVENIKSNLIKNGYLPFLINKKKYLNFKISSNQNHLKDKSNVHYFNFTCICESCHHFKTRIEEHVKRGNKSHIFKHLHSTATCFDSYNSLCFKIIDKANCKFDLRRLYILIGENSSSLTLIIGIFLLC